MKDRFGTICTAVVAFACVFGVIAITRAQLAQLSAEPAAPTVEQRLADNPATKAIPLKIAGPDATEAAATVEAGNMVKLEATGGNYPMLSWECAPATKNFAWVGNRAFFCSPAAGKFTVVLAASDGKELKTVVHEIEVTGGPEPGPTPPGPGPKPPVPVVSLKTLAKGWLAKVQTQDKYGECQRLANGFEAVAAQIAAGTLKEPQAIIDATANNNRIAIGLTSLLAWKPVFESLRAELNAREKAGPLDYGSLWREIVEALREVQPPVPVPAPQPSKSTPTAQSQAQRKAA